MTEHYDWTADETQQTVEKKISSVKIIAIILVILAAAVLFITSVTRMNAQYMMTAGELMTRSEEMTGKNLRVSGFVVPESINYDAASLHLEFDITDLGESAGEALRVVVDGEPLPDQMKGEAEAIVEGTLNTDGVFHAEKLMMKCASKYESSPSDNS